VGPTPVGQVEGGLKKLSRNTDGATAQQACDKALTTLAGIRAVRTRRLSFLTVSALGIYHRFFASLGSRAPACLSRPPTSDSWPFVAELHKPGKIHHLQPLGSPLQGLGAIPAGTLTL